MSKLSVLTVKVLPKIHLVLNGQSLPWLAAGAFLLWWTGDYSHKCLVDACKEMREAKLNVIMSGEEHT